MPAELFQILKNNAVKVLHSICQQTGKLSSGHRTGKGQFSFLSQRNAMPNNFQIILQLPWFHMLSRLWAKFLMLSFSRTWTENFQIFRLDSEKADDHIANIHWIIEKARELQKKIYFCLIDSAKPLTVWITTTCGIFLKRWEYQTNLAASWEICMQVKKQQ